MQVRVARHTERLEEVVRFYRDALGLAEIGRFERHAGYDGVFLDLPGTGAHWSSRPAAPTPRPSRTPSRCSCSTSAPRTRCGRPAERAARDAGGAGQPVLGRARHHVRGPRRLPRRPRGGYMVSTLADAVRSYERQIVDLTRRLVAIPSENPPGRHYRECAETLADAMRDIGLEPRTTDTHCVQASTAGRGRCLYLHGHYDVVPAQDTAPVRPRAARRADPRPRQRRHEGRPRRDALRGRRGARRRRSSSTAGSA